MSLPAPAFVIERAETAEALQEAIDLRIQVFVDEQRFPLDTEVDEHDTLAPTAHFVLRLLPARAVGGTIRIRRAPGGYYKIERLCVRTDSRKYGFGALLVKHAQDWALADAPPGPHKHIEALVHAQIPVIPFYKRLGYAEEVRPLLFSPPACWACILRTPRLHGI